MRKVGSHRIQPVYCNPLVGIALPFEHKRIRLVAGNTFSSQEDNGVTVVSLKLGPGASEEPAFKTDFTKQVIQAICELRVAACKRVDQHFVDGFDAE